MRLNPRHDEQRWAVLNSQIAVLAGSKLNTDKMMLEQLDLLVQPTQFLEYLRKTMPMSEDQLDMITTMHDTMIQRLNALEVLHKGGQRAVDEFMSSSLTGMEKLKSAPSQRPRGRQTTSMVQLGRGTVEMAAVAADLLQAAARAMEAIRIPEGRVRLEYNVKSASVSGIRRRIARAKVCNEIAVG
jgi:hypothetical protein